MDTTHDYDAACKAAATAQGLDPLTVLSDHYDYSVAQTGGFCMVGMVNKEGTTNYVGLTASEVTADRFLVVFYDNEADPDNYDEEGTVLSEAATLKEIRFLLDTWLKEVAI